MDFINEPYLVEAFMKKYILIFLFILALFASPVSALDASNIESDAALLMDRDTGQILFEKNAREKRYPASITKVLTGLLVVEHLELDQTLVVPEEVPPMIEPGSSQVYLIPGERLTVKELLYTLFVESANDAAATFALEIGGSMEGFAKMMNQKAAELGAKNSHFVNPHGLHSDEHYTSPYDMALIMAEASKDPILAEMMQTVNVDIDATNKQETRHLWTRNQLIRDVYSDYYYEDVFASKTGYTSKAGTTLVSSAERKGRNCVAVVMGGIGESTFRDTVALFDYGFDAFAEQTLFDAREALEEIPFETGTNPLSVGIEEEIVVLSESSSPAEVTTSLQMKEDLALPIKENDPVGSMEIFLDGTLFRQVPLIALNSVEEEGTLFSTLAPFGGVFFIGTLGLVTVRTINIKKRRKRRLQRLRQKYKNPYSGF
ncbi:MAG TPA: hypothetical protein DHN33_02830 [Eubacteriaceae bacterium]|nr:hypothetical protein [Eubacteriaceae bacterium]